MKEKMHIAVLSLGICTLIGMTFAVSVRDYKEKTPKLNSASEATTSSKKFECTKEAVSEKSPATKEYKKNLDKLTKLIEKFGDLGGNTSTLEDPCTGLKGKEKTECNINNVELRGLLNQIKKLEEKMLPYEECQEKLGITGDTDKEISGEVETKKKSEKTEKPSTKTEEKKYKCTETDDGLDYTKKGSVTGIWDFYTGDLSDPTLTSTHTDMCLNNYGTTNDLPVGLLEYSCNSDGRKTEEHYKCPNGCKDGACVNGADNKKDTARWYEGEWSTCSNGKQTRKVECQSNDKKVEDAKCEGKKPVTSKTCTEIAKNTSTLENSKNCGMVDSRAFDIDVTRKEQENKNMLCFSTAIASCSPSNLKILDKENGDFSFQVHGKKSGLCSISANVEEYKKKCNFSLDLISAFVKYAKDNGKPMAELSVVIGSSIIFDTEFNAKLNKEYQISCQEFVNDKLVTPSK